MNDKRIIYFPQNVLDVLSSDVLRIDYAELRSIYKDWRTEICNDAISLSPLREWRCDGFSLAPLATNANN